MVFMRIVSLGLLAVDALGMLALILAGVSAMSSRSDAGLAPIFFLLAALVGAAAAGGWSLRNRERPGLACLPLGLVLPLALYGIGMAALVMSPGQHH